jgi:hypothetical protein
MTALAGVIPFEIGGLKSNIEIVRRIPGVSDSVDALAIQAEWNGKTIRVLDPISLLACKLELVASVPQEKRHDVPHLKILLPWQMRKQSVSRTRSRRLASRAASRVVSGEAAGNCQAVSE